MSEAARLVRNAVDIGRDEAVALSSAGAVLAYVLGDIDSGVAFVNRALFLNQNLAMAWGISGYMNVCLGNHEIAIRHSARAMRLSPLDPRLWQWSFNNALGHFSQAVMTRPHHALKAHCEISRTMLGQYVSSRPVMRLPAVWKKRRMQ